MTLRQLYSTSLTIWMWCNIAQAAPQQRGTVQGVVLDAETGKPIANARVQLQTLYHVYGRLDVASATSNLAGAFTIHAAPNEYYFLSASKPGYLSGAAVPEPESFSLDESERRTDFVFKLIREGVVRGKLTDADGDLVRQTALSVWQWCFAGGERYLAQRGSVQVRPDGTFVIRNLRPGDVYLQARRSWEHADYGDQPRMDQSLPTFYRDAANATSAQPIRIVPGAEISGIELRMRRGLLYRVQGSATGPDGMEELSISLCAAWTQQSCLPARVQPDGRFRLDNIPAGQYELRGDALLRAPKAQSLRVSEQVTVNDGFRDLHVAFSETPVIKTILHGGHGSVQLVSLPDSVHAATLVYGNQESGSVGVYPGRYRVAEIELEEGKYVESIRSAGRDVTEGFQLSAPGLTLDIVLASGAGILHGTVRNGQGKAQKDVAVTVWPEAGASRLARTTISQQNGAYEFANLPPGEYRVAAWRGVSPGVAQYRGFFESFTTDASSVRVSPGANLEVNSIAIAEKIATERLNKLQ